MTDKPILFSRPMVRALRAGTKTQTRRVIKPQPQWHAKDVAGWGEAGWAWGPLSSWPDATRFGAQLATKMPIQPGDRLYVRELWRINKIWDAVAPRDLGDIGLVTYEADQGMRYFSGRLRQGMHMPKRLSRLTLHVTEVRAQRLQDISEEDAKAEGVDPVREFTEASYDRGSQFYYAKAYASLWDRINGAGSWDANPWVAAYTFEVERCNIAEARGG